MTEIWISAKQPLLYRRSLLFVCVVLWQLTGLVGAKHVEASFESGPSRDALIILYLDSDQDSATEIRESLQEWVNSRNAVVLHVIDLATADSREKSRYQKFLDYFSIKQDVTPLLIGCNSYQYQGLNGENVQDYAARMLRVDVYTRRGCSHCDDAKQYLRSLQTKYPGFEFRVRDILSDTAARTELIALTRRYRQAAASVPVFHLCNQIVVGFLGAEITGYRLEKILASWTRPSPQTQSRMEPPRFPTTDPRHQFVLFQPGDHGQFSVPPEPEPFTVALAVQDDDLFLPPELPLDPEVPTAAPEPETITLPWLGKITVNDLGMPLFTVVVGLVDGFNPCAMWVLLFLLSLLVNLKSRARILLIASTFVLVSGLAYFTFMAAWLNVFLLIGYLRSVQVVLALIAIAVASIHIKDFFLFKKGVSLSIPDSAKPGIYARTREIITAENLVGALCGAFVLAVLVNVVELLCTAGLPALYTEILTQQGYSTAKNYAYLLLYNVAYMFDDGLMVAVVVITLEKSKLQERQGRWLKLFSGLVIMALGLVMLFRPDWLA